MFESGWVWLSAKIADVRFIRRPIANQLHLGHRQGAPQFNLQYRSLFHLIVYDPSKFLKKGFARLNYCVLAALILQMRLKTGETLRNLTLGRMESEMNLIDYSELITPARTGISARNLPALEKKLSPIPKSVINRFGAMCVFEGVAINLYEIRSSDGEHRLFPISLSKHYQKVRNFFQLDLLFDSKEYRMSDKYEMPTNHVLLISDIRQLLHRFHPTLHNNRHRDKMSMLCRACFYHTSDFSLLTKHWDICTTQQRTSIGRRNCKNILLHQTHTKNKFSGKLERNGLTFRRADSKMLIKPLCLIALDYESVQHSTSEIDEHGSTVRQSDGMSSKTPKQAITTLPIISVAYAFMNNYEQHPLPPTLSEPRFLRVKDDEPDGEKNFFISFLLKLRHDLLLHYIWMQQVLSLDRGPPPYHERPTHLQNAYANITHCQLCGRRWGQKCYSQR